MSPRDFFAIRCCTDSVAPSELRHVKQALFALLDVSPSEVFSIMAEDCKGTEAETGASRRNILEFLYTDAKSKRKELLESGKYIEAENTFSSGFYNVLGTTAIAETRLVLSLLLPLSTISGRNSTRASSGKFAKTLIKCLHPRSSVGMTMPVIKLWVEFVGRADGLDPSWMLCFLADHGDAVVQAAIEKGDKEAKSILEYPNTSGSSRLRRYFDRDADRSEPDLEARKLLPAFAQTMLNTVFVSFCVETSETASDNPAVLDQVKYRVKRCLHPRIGHVWSLLRSHPRPLHARPYFQTSFSSIDGIRSSGQEESAISKRRSGSRSLVESEGYGGDLG